MCRVASPIIPYLITLMHFTYFSFSGVFDTPMLKTLPDKVRHLLSMQSVHPQRLGNAAEFAHMARALVENPFMNGEVIRIDAGIRMQ